MDVMILRALCTSFCSSNFEHSILSRLMKFGYAAEWNIQVLRLVSVLIPKFSIFVSRLLDQLSSRFARHFQELIPCVFAYVLLLL